MEMAERIPPINDVLIVKVGTTTMFKHEQGRERLDHDSLKQIGAQVLRLRERGTNVALVSSGAVTAGMEATGTLVRPKGDEAMPETQRLATIGWHRVLTAWERALGTTTVGGLLITRRELNLDTPEHDEVLRTTHTLLRHGDVPILNENDGITHAELSNQSFGQNDTLAAVYAAQIAHSELFGAQVKLVLLSDVDGVYQDVNDSDSVIPVIEDIAAYEHVAGGTNGAMGRGGMRTKFEAAQIAMTAGVDMWVANGRSEEVIERAIAGEIGTHFKA
jgi:glutamate 5-kinase